MIIQVKTGGRGASWQRTWELKRTHQEGLISGISQCTQNSIGRLMISQEAYEQVILPRPETMRLREDMFRSLRSWVSDHVLEAEIDSNKLVPWPKNPQALLSQLLDKMPTTKAKQNIYDVAISFGRTLRRCLPIPRNVLTDEQIMQKVDSESRVFQFFPDPKWPIPAVMLEPLLEAVKESLLAEELIMPGPRPLVDLLIEATEVISEQAHDKNLVVDVKLVPALKDSEKVQAQVSAWRQFPRSRWREIEWKVKLGPLPRPFKNPQKPQMDLRLV